VASKERNSNTATQQHCFISQLVFGYA